VDEKELILQLQRPKATRSYHSEVASFNKIVICIHKAEIFELCKSEIMKIIDYKGNLVSRIRAKQSLYPSFKVLIYSESILNDPSLSDFCKSITTVYQDVGTASEI
jgi:hypothetical protein